LLQFFYLFERQIFRYNGKKEIQTRRGLVMKKISWKLWIFVAVVGVALVMFGTACATGDKGQEKADTLAEVSQTQGEEGEHVHEQGEAEHTHGEEGEQTHEHSEEGEHTQGEEGEESGEKLALTDTYDNVRKGVRLVLAYHNASSSFVGSVENVTDETIKDVLVEVHLSTGVELGPTERMDLAPGEKAGVKLEAQGHVFEWWTTHAESGSSENGLTM
jgi:hypothetical protein